MRKPLILGLVIAVGVAGFFYYRRGQAQTDSASLQQGVGGPAAPGATGRGRGAGGGRQGGAGGAFGRLPMTVELAAADKGQVSESITVVGNLVGEVTVAVAAKVSGRLQEVYVDLGDAVGRGARIAKVEDQELREQVKQAEASFAVAEATVRQREADLRFAETALARSRNLFDRQLLPRQTLDDAEARSQASTAQLDLARAQNAQAQARLDELRINLANTLIVSPLNGFVGKRFLDPGAFVNSNTTVVSVVDISNVRMVANLVERDLRRVNVGDLASAEVDAFPGERFAGQVARVAPVLDPATRTSEMEIELPNPGNRLKPGMYARVNLTVEQRTDALVVPRNALVDVEGRRGVFVAEGEVARFTPVEIGLQDTERVEITRGLELGVQVVTTGAAALRDGDRILLAGQGASPAGGAQDAENAPRRGEPGMGGRGRRGGAGGRGPAQAPPGASDGLQPGGRGPAGRPEAGRANGGGRTGSPDRRLAPDGERPSSSPRTETSGTP